MLAKLALGNVRKSIRDFGIYFLTIALGVAVFYAFNSITDQQAVTAIGSSSSLRELLVDILNDVSIFIAFILAFLVIYANRFLIRRRKHEFGIYLTLGMRKRDVLTIVSIETILVSAASLIFGLILGWVFSQVLMHVTASMFQGTLNGFVYGYSMVGLTRSIIVFLAIFLVASFANARAVTKDKLIDLLHAGQKNETLKLRNLALSFVLFIVSCGIIAYSYYLLHSNGLTNPSPQLLEATILVCVGTALLFYSLSGFLLKLVQMIKPLYLRGLNMFTLRQLAAKVNTTFASMTVICLALFLAITSVCSGIGCTNALSSSIAKTTAYDATTSATWSSYKTMMGVEANPDCYEQCTLDQDNHMLPALSNLASQRNAADPARLVDRSAQVDFWIDPQDMITFSDLESCTNTSLSDYTNTSANPEYGMYPCTIIKLSQVNDALSIAGKDTITLADNECALYSTSNETQAFFQHVADLHPTLSVSGQQLHVASFTDTCLATEPVPRDMGSIIVPDNMVSQDAVLCYSDLDVMCNGDQNRDAFEAEVNELLSPTDPDLADQQTSAYTCTPLSVMNQSSGLSGIVAFLAVYIGFVLTIVCAAILAIQQLSEASDNARRYTLLRKLGTPERMISTSLFTQILIYFLFPLALAICHSICAVNETASVIQLFGQLDIGATALTTASAFIATYGVYFVVTYVSARRLAHEKM
ncbi:MAG: ABC transporter permease [Eggerthellaceae bacterium]|jgi:putative ABC transport system permease protein|nr:ABC transporter permease [Eggerthellaceae bacterium]MCH4221618.1 ABC transporter permease [Eggerthellaceae bacterium]